MADSDEENPRPSTTNTASHHNSTTANPVTDPDGDADHDLSEETQDFRFLSSLTTTPNATSSPSTTTTSASGGPTLPRRGEKDFEPNPTKSQEATLRASRQAMHDALSVERIHGSKGWVVGYFTGAAAAAGGGTGGTGVEDGKGRDKRAERCVVRVDAPRGPHFRTMGVSDGRNRVWLLPEEALYLVERGSLDARWGVPGEEGKGEGEGKAEDVDGGDGDGDGDGDAAPPALSDLPMSLQGAYATFISEDDLTLAKYTVFAGLRRSGYTVIRAPTWDDNTSPSDASHQISRVPENKAVSSIAPSRTSYWFNWPSLRNFLARAIRFLFRLFPSKTSQRHANSCPSLGPLVAPGLYRSYADIYRALTLIPFHDPLSSRSSPPSSERPTNPSSIEPKSSPNPTSPLTSNIPPFRIHYHVYKPNTPYRKTSPPPPDFYLAVIDARSHPHLPSMTEIGTLLEEMPIADPKEDDRLKKGRPEMRLKAGTRNVVLAVVDGGVVSFLRVAETVSGREKIYEGKGGGRRGGKGARRGGGGRGGGGGAGRGRGRGR